MKLKEVIIASQNQHKIDELNSILDNFGMKGISLKEVSLSDINIVEDGDTFEANSYKKAKTICDLTKMITIADDSGLEVYALDNKPGVYSSRFAGENATDRENNEKLIEQLKDVDDENRGARYVCVITLLDNSGLKIVAKGIVEGYITREPRGNQGFGYDPYFVPKGYDKTFAEMSVEEKNEISHRAEALAELKKQLIARNYNE